MTRYSSRGVSSSSNSRSKAAPQRIRRNSNTAAYQRSFHLGPISNILLVGLIITVMGVMYLVQITKTSVYGFELTELRDSQTELVQRNEALRVEAARLQSLDRTNGSDVAKDLVPQTDLSYLSN